LNAKYAKVKNLAKSKIWQSKKFGELCLPLHFEHSLSNLVTFLLFNSFSHKSFIPTIFLPLNFPFEIPRFAKDFGSDFGAKTELQFRARALKSTFFSLNFHFKKGK
jgi:hypothetical protein